MALGAVRRLWRIGWRVESMVSVESIRDKRADIYGLHVRDCRHVGLRLEPQLEVERSHVSQGRTPRLARESSRAPVRAETCTTFLHFNSDPLLRGTGQWPQRLCLCASGCTLDVAALHVAGARPTRTLPLRSLFNVDGVFRLCSFIAAG